MFTLLSLVGSTSSLRYYASVYYDKSQIANPRKLNGKVILWLSGLKMEGEIFLQKQSHCKNARCHNPENYISMKTTSVMNEENVHTD
jgi:hypothetical protein